MQGSIRPQDESCPTGRRYKKRDQAPFLLSHDLFVDFPLVFAFPFGQADFAVFRFVSTFAGVQDDAIRQISVEDFGFFLVLRQDDVHREGVIGRVNQLNVGGIEDLHAFVAHGGPGLTGRRHAAVGVFFSACCWLLNGLLCCCINFRRGGSGIC